MRRLWIASLSRCAAARLRLRERRVSGSFLVSANLRITKSDSPIRRGSASLTYAIGIENLGPAPATGVTVT